MSVQRLAELFAENFESFGELGASVCVWRNGTEIVSWGQGWRDRGRTEAWDAKTPVLFWSATKGLSSACVLRALGEVGLHPATTRVAEVWPEFAQAGKDRVMIAELLSHQAGLPALSTPVEVWDFDGTVAALAAEPPHWPLGEGHGYHPRTFGFLMDELVRRLSGKRIRDYWREHFAEPLGIDLWIGVPAEQVDRVAPVFPAKTAPPKGDIFYTAFLSAGSLTARSFASPKGLFSPASMNQPEARMGSFPGFGGVGTAAGLAKFYAMLAAGGELEGRRYLDSMALDWMTTTLTQGPDHVLKIETAFSCGFMQDPVDVDGTKKRKNFGPSLRAFGHPGAGGSHAFADPENGIAFAYVMNQMEPGVLPNAKALRLVDALYSIA